MLHHRETDKVFLERISITIMNHLVYSGQDVVGILEPTSDQTSSLLEIASISWF